MGRLRDDGENDQYAGFVDSRDCVRFAGIGWLRSRAFRGLRQHREAMKRSSHRFA
jgi:hypothetical protein